MSQSTLADDDLFGEAANEMQEDVEESLEAAREELPDPDDVWDTDADNVLGVLNGLKTALDVDDARDHLRDAKKWFTMGERADAFEDADALADDVETVAELIETVEEAHEDVTELSATVPELRGDLQDAAEADEDEAEDAEEAEDDADAEDEAEDADAEDEEAEEEDDAAADADEEETAAA